MNRYQNRYKYRDNGLDDNLLRVMKAYYYACISFIDYQVGRILDALRQTGQLDHTLVLFTSDHGEFLGDYDCFGKRSMLDSAARIPMLARYPDRFPAGLRCQVPTSLVDIMSTFLSAAGIDPTSYGRDGLDLGEVVRDAGSTTMQERTIYSQFQRDALGVYMAVSQRYKYLYSAPDRREFLFDRVQDPQEFRNRSGLAFCQQDLRAMRQGLWAYYRRQGHDAPLDGDAWRVFPQPTIPLDPDEGLLIQDPPWAAPYQAIPGYKD